MKLSFPSQAKGTTLCVRLRPGAREQLAHLAHLHGKSLSAVIDALIRAAAAGPKAR